MWWASTSAAFCPLQWDADESQWEAPTDIEMENNRKVIPSAITLLPDGRAFIGAKAFEPGILKHAEVHTCFKKKSEDINGEAVKLMIRFMEEVYKLIRKNTSGVLTDDNHIVYIATPSGWDEPAQALYKQMAEKAGIPIDGEKRFFQHHYGNILLVVMVCVCWGAVPAGSLMWPFGMGVKAHRGRRPCRNPL